MTLKTLVFGHPIHSKSGGTSWDAYRLENELGLYDEKWHFDTLLWVLEKLSSHFSVKQPTLVRNNRMGGGRRRTLFGRYRYSYSGTLNQIELSGGGQATGFTLGTVMHEFSHHLNLVRDGGRAHDWSFKRAQEEVILAYDSDVIFTPEELQTEEQLVTLNEINEKLFTALYNEFDTEKEMAERARELLGKHWVDNYEVK